MPLEIVGPLGRFYLRDIRRPLLLLAGGTGLAPFLSMLSQVAQTGTEKQLVHLVHGVSNDSDLVGVDRLETLAKTIDNFSFTTCITNPSSTHPFKEFITDNIELGYRHGGNVDVYVCGPPGMVEAIRAWLTKHGVIPVNFYTEKFLPSSLATPVS